jgi:hypothetical protein
MGDRSMIHESVYTKYTNVKEIRDASDGSFEAFDVDGLPVAMDKLWVDAEIVRLQAAYDSQDYARKRRVEYAKLNQYEMMFDDQRDSTTTWVDAVNAIKAQFPKPS